MSISKSLYDVLKHELSAVSSVAPFGAHKAVAEAVGISEKYSKQIRDYDGAKLPTVENAELIKKMIAQYRKINKEEVEKLTR